MCCVVAKCCAVCSQYSTFDLYCIHSGQWDGKVVGRRGALAMIVMEVASCLSIYWYWGRWAYTTKLPPRYKAAGKDRIDLFAE